MHNQEFEYLVSPSIIVKFNSINKAYEENILKYASEIEHAWESEQKRRQKNLFNGKMLNLATIEKQEKGLNLVCHTIDYKHYLAQRVGKLPLNITPLAVSGIVFFKDENTKIFFIGKRSQSITQYPEYYEFIPSGSIDVNNLEAGQEIVDYKKQLLLELKEELSVDSGDVKSCSGFSLIFDSTDRVYDIGIEIEIKNCHNVKINESEYSTLERVPMDSVRKYFTGKNVVPTSRTLFDAWHHFRLKGA